MAKIDKLVKDIEFAVNTRGSMEVVFKWLTSNMNEELTVRNELTSKGYKFTPSQMEGFTVISKETQNV